MKRRIFSALAIAVLLAAGVAGAFTVTPAAKASLNFPKIGYALNFPKITYSDAKTGLNFTKITYSNQG